MNTLEQEIIQIVAEESGVEQAKIKPGVSLYRLGIDSLSSLAILAALEEKYDIIIPENDLKHVDSINDIIRIVSGELEEKKGEKQEIKT
jgi:acyl carrier protein